MKPQNSDAVDIALSRFWSGEPPAAILADFPAESAELGPLLETAAALEAVRPVEMPGAEDFLADRNRFLATAASLPSLAAPPGVPTRLRGWMSDLFPAHLSALMFSGGQFRRMGAFLLIAVLVSALLVGILGGTAVVAAESLPGSQLYPLKLTIEQVRLAMAPEPGQRAAIFLTQAQERIQEMTELAAAGEVPDEGLLTAAQLRFNQAFESASQTPDTMMLGLLIQVRRTVQTQAEALAQTRVQVSEPAQKALRQAEHLLTEVRRAAEAGLEDPQAFRGQFSGINLPGCDPNTPCGDPCGDGNCQQSPKTEPEQEQIKATPENDCTSDDCREPQTRVPAQEQLRPDNGCGRDGCDQTRTREPAPVQLQSDDGCDRGRCGETHTPEPVQDQRPAEDNCGQGGCQPIPTRQPVQKPPQADSNCDQGECQPSEPQEQGQEQTGSGNKQASTPTGQSGPEPTSSPDPTSTNPSGGDENDGSGSSDSGDSGGSGGGSSDGGGGRGKGKQ